MVRAHRRVVLPVQRHLFGLMPAHLRRTTTTVLRSINMPSPYRIEPFRTVDLPDAPALVL